MALRPSWRSPLSSLYNIKGRPLSAIQHSPSVKPRPFSTFVAPTSPRASLASSFRPQRPVAGRIQRQRPVAAPSCLSQRFASTATPTPKIPSTTTETSTTTITTTEAPPEAAPSPESWDAVMDSLHQGPAADTAPHVGYLHDLGINFGWGTTSMIQWVVEHICVYSGWSWLASVCVSAVLIRLALVKLFMNGSDTAARNAWLKPHLAPLDAAVSEAQKSGDSERVQRLFLERLKFSNSHGVYLLRTFYPMLLQLPLGFGFFRLARSMALTPIPGLDQAGPAWLTNLTVADPYYIVPATTCAILYILLKSGGEMGGHEMAAWQKRFASIMPIGAFVATSFLPAIVQVTFLTTTCFAVIQTKLIRSPGFRQRFGMTIFPPPDYNAQVVAKKQGGYEGKVAWSKNMQQSPAPPQEKGFKGLLKSARAARDKWAERMENAQKKDRGRLTQQERRVADAFELRRRAEIDSEKLARHSQK